MTAIATLTHHLEGINLGATDDARRLFHGRGNCYQGLQFINIDWFAPVIWAVVYGELEAELLADVEQCLIAFAKNQPEVEAVCLQQRIKGRAAQKILLGQLPEKPVAKEGENRFYLNFTDNQNIGYFLDAAPGRKWLQGEAKDKNVLNLFAYTCAFSTAAIAGGAQSVVNIDMAKAAIATGQKNVVLNQQDPRQVKFLPHDIFRSTKKLTQLGPYDIVIIDPPSRQKGSFEAEKDYLKLLKKLPPMLGENAQILACLNAPYLDEQFLIEKMAEALPEYSLQKRIAHRQDFPEKDTAFNLKMQLFAKD